jgi:hypothetical protein
MSPETAGDLKTSAAIAGDIPRPPAIADDGILILEGVSRHVKC